FLRPIEIRNLQITSAGVGGVHFEFTAPRVEAGLGLAAIFGTKTSRIRCVRFVRNMRAFFCAVGLWNQPRLFNGRLWRHCCLPVSKFRPMKFVSNSRWPRWNCEMRLFSQRLLGAESFRPAPSPFARRSYRKFLRMFTASHDGR